MYWTGGFGAFLLLVIIGLFSDDLSV